LKPPALSAPGAAFVGAWEGFRADCYDDAGGNCTIGYGHLIHYGKTTPNDRTRWGSLTEAQGRRLLQGDAHTALMGIERHIAVALTQPQIDALCSFAYNCGPEALTGVVGAAVNGKPRKPWPLNIRPLQVWHATVAAALLQWDHVGGKVLPGLEHRRQSEGILFGSGKYTKAQGNSAANA
jgi:GH24 family phage-related lysozyme (muramidase)